MLGRMGFAWAGWSALQRIDPDRIGDVLELDRAEIGDREIKPPPDLPVGFLDRQIAPGLRSLRAARRY